jgi:hypothetical protein
MNKIISVIFLCATVAFAQSATAGRFSVTYLKTAQVKKIFSGKTISGSDLERGTRFKRYFDPNGTILSDANGYKSTGQWHVDSHGALCVKWDNEGQERCDHIKDNGDGTYTKTRNKNIKKIPLVEYKDFTDGNLFAQGGEPVDVEVFKHSSNDALQADGELLQAVTNNDLVRLNKALAAGANVNATFKRFRTALFFAVKNKNAQIINKLIAVGADVNAQDKRGNTPLLVATKHDDIGTVQVLLQNGADAKIKNHAGKTAMRVAEKNKSVEIINILRENSYGGTALGMFIDIKNKHISEAQFRQAAVKAFEARNWHVDKAENNVVSGTYTRNDDRIFKSRMIFQPDLLLIRFDSAMGYPKANYLVALQTLFFHELERQ